MNKLVSSPTSSLPESERMSDSPATKIEVSSQERCFARRFVVALVAVFFLGALGTYALVRWQAPKKGEDGSHWQQAVQALEADDFALAKTHLAQCLEVWPIHAEARFLMARTCRRADDYAGWQVHLRRAEVLGLDKDSLHLERAPMQAPAGALR